MISPTAPLKRFNLNSRSEFLISFPTHFLIVGFLKIKPYYNEKKE